MRHSRRGKNLTGKTPPFGNTVPMPVSALHPNLDPGMAAKLRLP